MKKFKKGKQGWWMGSRFTIVSARTWNGDVAYQVRYDGSRSIDYYSHRFLMKEKAFQFDPKTGEWKGPHIVHE